MNRLLLVSLFLFVAACDSSDNQLSGCGSNCDGTIETISVNAGEDIQGFELDTVVLNGSASYSGEATLRFLWSQVSGPAVVLDSADSPVVSFVAPVLARSFEEMTFRLTVSASDGAVGSDTVVVEIEQGVAIVPQELEFNDTLESAMALSFSRDVVPTAVASSVSGAVGYHPTAADLADVFVFSPPESGIYELRLCVYQPACGPDGAAPDLQLTLNDQDNVVLAWSGNEFTQSGAFSIPLFAGLPYYAVVQSLEEPARRSNYTLSIILHQSD